MKIVQKFICFTLFLFTAVFFSVFVSNAQTTHSTFFDDRQTCDDSKGIWREFGNGCADNCASKFDKYSICTASIIFACDCGKGRCWNGEECTPMTSYKKIYEKDVEENERILEEKAKERREKIKNNPALSHYLQNLYEKQNAQQNTQGQPQGQQAQGQQPQGQPQPYYAPGQSQANMINSNPNAGREIGSQPLSPITEIHIAPTANSTADQEIKIPPMFLQKEQEKANNPVIQEPQLPIIPLP